MATPTATRFPFTTRFRPQRLATSSLLIHRRATASALDRATGGLSLHPPPLRRPGRPCRPPGRITDKRFGHHLRQPAPGVLRSEEHTSELQSLMRTSYAVFCLQKKNNILLNSQSNTS